MASVIYFPALMLVGMATRPTEKPSKPAESDPEAEAAVGEDLNRFVAPVVGPDDEHRYTDSGIDVQRVYDEDAVAPGLPERLGEPGEFPYTRGVHPGMYRDRLWTMRQYAGYATAEETNRRYRYPVSYTHLTLPTIYSV